MRKEITAAMLPLLLLGACSSSEPDFTSPEVHGTDNPNFIPLSEALRNADEHFKAVFGPSTRSVRKVGEVETFRPTATRSADDDEAFGFYIVNYGDAEGFAILSADRRREAVYAVSDEGSLHLIDTVWNKGLGWYLNQHVGTLNSFPLNPVNPPQPIDTTIAPKPVVPTCNYTYLSSELLKGVKSGFDQFSPYNKYCFTRDGRQAAVGCVPMAIGTIMGYYEWPKSAFGYNFNWSQMSNNRENDGWARLFEILGRPTMLNVNYGVDGSATPGNIDHINVFSKMGYENTVSSAFSVDILNGQLRSSNPVYCGGVTFETELPGGHAWVIDGGYIKEIVYTYMNPDNPPRAYSYYYHCVWGWGGAGNGYFYYDGHHTDSSDNTIGGSPSPSTSNGERVYSFSHLHLLYGYTPKK